MGRDETVIIENVGLKLSLGKKVRMGRGKSADTALFKFKNTKIYINARARKNPRKKWCGAGRPH